MWVSGLVQGVWFRQSARERAEALGVHGRVRNLPDGRVELEIEGSPGAVDVLIDWCRTGPDRARVDTVEVVEATATGQRGFRVS